jgi:hypothetical protein
LPTLDAHTQDHPDSYTTSLMVAVEQHILAAGQPQMLGGKLMEAWMAVDDKQLANREQKRACKAAAHRY